MTTTSSHKVAAIHARGLTKAFRPTATWGDWIRGRFKRSPVNALNGVNLEVGVGQLVGLAGPNGAGKSTLLRVIAGLLLPGSGTVEVCGLDVQRQERQYKEAVGYALSDERSHFWRLTGRENLRFFATLHGMTGTERDNRVTELLEVVDLADDAGRPVREFSTGMRQRLSVARGLLGRPKLLLLDEPTRGLDPKSSGRIRDFVMGELVEKHKMAVLYATHRVDEMRDFCPRLLLMNDGKVVGDGSFDSVRDTFEEVFGR
jgi:ABC-2 type transport system ATP-binding protein